MGDPVFGGSEASVAPKNMNDIWSILKYFLIPRSTSRIGALVWRSIHQMLKVKKEIRMNYLN